MEDQQLKTIDAVLAQTPGGLGQRVRQCTSVLLCARLRSEELYDRRRPGLVRSGVGNRRTTHCRHVPSLMSEPGLTLMADRQNQYGVVLRFVAIERHIACLAAGDDQLAEIVCHRTTDLRMTFQD